MTDYRGIKKSEKKKERDKNKKGTENNSGGAAVVRRSLATVFSWKSLHTANRLTA